MLYFLFQIVFAVISTIITIMFVSVGLFLFGFFAIVSFIFGIIAIPIVFVVFIILYLIER
jgi:hypothetical protein